MPLYLDVNAIIDIVEGSEAVAECFAELATAAGQAGTTILTSELSLAEVLVKPLREQDFGLIVAYNNLLAGGHESQIQTVPVSREVLGLAARVRNRKKSIKLPDAIHIATAEVTKCDAIVTADKGWHGATAIQLGDPTEFNLVGFIRMFS